MELSYWQSRWKKQKIGFHMPGGYPGLRKHWLRLDLRSNPTILVPLCGKTVDMVWLEQQNATVIGSEISEDAVLEFMEENERNYSTKSYADFKIYQTGDIQIWQGDFMKLPVSKLPTIDLIYDKAALVALPREKRAPYMKKILNFCTDNTRILLHHFEYPQEEMPGPPFSVPLREIKSHIKKPFQTTILEANTIPLDNFQKFKHRGLQTPIKEQLIFFDKNSG